MPELPDLQVFRNNLEKKFGGKKLKKIDVYYSQKINVTESVLKKHLEGKKLKGITRNGKELFFNFDKDQVLAFHLMLNGEFHFFMEASLYKNKIIELLFEDKSGLLLTDRNRYANARLNPEMPDVPDAQSKEFDLHYLEAGFKKFKNKRIKDLLIEQSFVRGIGNAYVDEILWDSGIHPASKAGKIPAKKTKELYDSINKVLTDAVKQIIKRDPDIISGEIREFLKVHNSKLKHTPTGGTIRKEDIGSRITYFTDEQVLYE
ncbi:MAG: DNA-formamidopyrimidine glycosylase family protein [Ignavibacteriaceae bacterium]